MPNIYEVWAYPVFLCSALLHFTDTAFYKLKVSGEPASSKSTGANSPITFVHLCLYLQFGYSFSLSDFFIIISVSVIRNLYYHCNCLGAPWTVPI